MTNASATTGTLQAEAASGATPSDGEDLYKLLKEAVRSSEAAAFRAQLALMPAAGWEHPIIRPPVYAKSNGEGPTLIINTVRRGDEVRRLTMAESYEARAHRMAEAIRSLQHHGIELPVIEFYYEIGAGGPECLVCDSFSAGHHVTDACWREAICIECGEGFHQCVHGSCLDPTKDIHPADLLRLYPTSLLSGYDPRSSHLASLTGPRRRPPEPWGRIAQSSILVEIAGGEDSHGEFYRSGGIIRPWETSGDATIYVAKSGQGWTTDPNKAERKDGQPRKWPKNADGDGGKAGKDDGKPSLIGLETVPPSKRAVPDVWAQKVTLSNYMAFARLRRLRFADNPVADEAAKCLVAALGIASLTLAETALSPRADCDLCLDTAATEPIRREMQIGGKVADLSNLDHGAVVDAVKKAVEGVRSAQEDSKPQLWAPQVIKVHASDRFQKVVDRNGLRRQR